MKNFCISLLVCIIISLTAVAVLLPENNTAATHTEYLRIHIRANSNDTAEQQVKYKVKDEIVEFLTPYLADCDTKQKAESLLRDKLDEIEKVADSVLERNGYTYTATARVTGENFPTRVYGDLTLDGGYYDALIVELGSGQGDNWWCVVYPPLCFVGNGEGYVYRSKLYRIINEFFDKTGGKNEKNG